MARLRTLLASSWSNVSARRICRRPSKRTVESNSRERVVLLPVLTHTFWILGHRGTLWGRRTLQGGMPTGHARERQPCRAVCGRQSGASRICCIGRQITEARPVQDPPAKGGGRQKFDLSRGEQIYQCLVMPPAIARACTWLLNAPTWIAQAPPFAVLISMLRARLPQERWPRPQALRAGRARTATQQPRERPGWRLQWYAGKDGTDRKRHLDRTSGR